MARCPEWWYSMRQGTRDSCHCPTAAGYRRLGFLHVSSEQDLPPEDGPDPIGEALAEVRDALSELTAAAKQEHERASHREPIIDRLPDENQLRRRGEIQVMHDPGRAALYRPH